MRLNFPDPEEDSRFRFGQDYARRMFIMAPVIELNCATNENSAQGVADRAVRPRASDWLWAPWHSKAWWTAIAIYWTGMAATFAIPVLDQFYSGMLAGFLNILFFPPLALMILGLGFARAWFVWSDWEEAEPTHEQMFPKSSVGGMRDPYSDPLDPRSGALHRRQFHRH